MQNVHRIERNFDLEGDAAKSKSSGPHSGLRIFFSLISLYAKGRPQIF